MIQSGNNLYWRPHSLCAAFLLSIFVAMAPWMGPLVSARAQDAEALTPPRLLSSSTWTPPEGTAPLPTDASMDLLLSIDAQGQVIEAQVLTPLRPDIDSHIVEAARAMRFEPAKRGAMAIPSRIRFHFAVPSAIPAATDQVPEESPGHEQAPEPALPEPPQATPVTEEPQAPSLDYGARAVVAPPEPGAATRVTLSGPELTTIPGTFGEPLRAVALLPGVARSPFGLGFFFVRGASFDTTGFLVDGFPVPLLYHLGAGPSVISPRLVERLDFYAGGYPVTYGRWNAGVISVHTAPPNVDEFRAELEVDLFRASAFAVVPLPNRAGTVAAAVRRSYFELFLPLIAPGVGLTFTDYQIRGDFRISEALRASLFVFGSEDLLDLRQAVGSGATASEANTRLGYSFFRVIGRLEARLGNGVRLSWSGTVGVDGNATTSRAPGQTALRSNLGGISLGQRAEAIWQPDDHFRTNIGIDYQAFLFDLGITAPSPPGLGEYPRPVFDPQALEVNARMIQQGVGAFAEQTLRFGALEIDGGLRLDHYRYGTVTASILDPRAVVRVHATEDLTFKASTGTFSQQPRPFQLVPNLGDPSLRPNRSWQNSIGVEAKLPWNLEVETTGFYNQMWSLARPGSGLVTEPDGTVRRQFFFDDAEGRSYGLEVLIRRRVEQGLYGWISYTLSRSERFLPGGRVLPFNFDQTHVLNFAISYAIDGWRFGARLTLATGRPTQAVIGSAYDADADEYTPIRGPLDGSERLPTFHQLDLRVDRDFSIGPVAGSVYIDALNIYNAPNSEGFVYQYDYARRDRLPGLPILATAGIRLVY